MELNFLRAMLAGTAIFISSCSSHGGHFESCHDTAIQSGSAASGKCDLSGYLIVSGGTVLVMQEYDPAGARACLESGCPSLSHTVGEVVREPYKSCHPTAISALSTFKFVRDENDGKPTGFPLITQMEPRLQKDAVACEFPVGFYLDPEE